MLYWSKIVADSSGIMSGSGSKGFLSKHPRADSYICRVSNFEWQSLKMVDCHYCDCHL